MKIFSEFSKKKKMNTTASQLAFSNLKNHLKQFTQLMRTHKPCQTMLIKEKIHYMCVTRTSSSRVMCERSDRFSYACSGAALSQSCICIDAAEPFCCSSEIDFDLRRLSSS
jgi:hypothetical protein